MKILEFVCFFFFFPFIARFKNNPSWPRLLPPKKSPKHLQVGGVVLESRKLWSCSWDKSNTVRRFPGDVEILGR